MRVPPSQSLTMVGGGRESRVAVLEPKRARHPRQPGAEGEDLDAVGALDGVRQGVGEAQMRLRAGLHGAGHVDEQQEVALPRPALEAGQADDVAVVPHGLAQHPAQVEASAPPRSGAAITSASGEARGRGAGEAAQRLPVVVRSEAPQRQGFRRGRGLPRLVDLVREERLLVSPALVANLDGIVLQAGDVRSDPLRAEEVDVEQSVEIAAALRRRGEGGVGGAPDVRDRARAEQADGGEESGRLLRRDGEAVGAEERRKGEEGCERRGSARSPPPSAGEGQIAKRAGRGAVASGFRTRRVSVCERVDSSGNGPSPCLPSAGCPSPAEGRGWALARSCRRLRQHPVEPAGARSADPPRPSAPPRSPA